MYAPTHCEAPLSRFAFSIPLLRALPAFSHGVPERAQRSTSELSPSLKAFTSDVAPGLHIPTFKMKLMTPPCLLQDLAQVSGRERHSYSACKNSAPPSDRPLLAVTQGRVQSLPPP